LTTHTSDTDAPVGGTIDAAPGSSLLDLDPGLVKRTVERRGAAIIRGSTVDPHAALELLGKLGDRCKPHFAATQRGGGSSLRNQRREFELEGQSRWAVSTVNEGDHGINAHSEATYSPLRPDLICFYCTGLPDEGGGQTFLTDGIQILRDVSAKTRQVLLDCIIRYEAVMPIQYLEQMTDLSFAELSRVWLTPANGCEHTPVEGGQKVAIRYTVPACPRVTFSDERAFANNLLASMQYRTIQLEQIQRFAPGLDEEAVREALEASFSGARWIAWRPGDLVVVDNSRVMHGREPLTNVSDRRIMVVMLRRNAGWRT